MTYQIGSTTITAEELSDMKRTDIDCEFWIKRIQKAREISIRRVLGAGETPANMRAELLKAALEVELAAIGVKVL